ncbi:MAG TPA: hypothetical protein VMF06_13690 [Candidatus Limnocylindria bacterium]|jgi:hypothetical protein|nr:hypothetical protein [Candidatus Limnocylindria bacterium]
MQTKFQPSAANLAQTVRFEKGGKSDWLRQIQSESSMNSKASTFPQSRVAYRLWRAEKARDWDDRKKLLTVLLPMGNTSSPDNR